MMRRGLRLPVSSVASQVRLGTTRDKVVSVEDAVYLIPDNATITVGGFVTQGAPEHVCEAIGRRFAETGSPKNLTLLCSGGVGNGRGLGLSHLAKPGLLKRYIGCLNGQNPALGDMIQRCELEAYFLPMGCVSRMIRCAASGSPGHVTKIGLGTFVDPAQGGGKMNAVTTEDVVKTIDIEGEKYLFYKALPIDVAVVRGTTADALGNVTMERESLLCDHLNQAMAGRSRRGVVIAQVERLAESDSLKPRDVHIPGTMVDCVVVAPREKHLMGYYCSYNAAYTGEVRPVPRSKGDRSFKLDVRKVIGRRAAMELLPDQVVAVGLGMPETVALVVEEEHVRDLVQLTTEGGVHGGVGATGVNFGPSKCPSAFLSQSSQFDFFSGGGLDCALLGNAETDASGNVTVAVVGSRIAGPGGFIDISQSTKVVTMLGTFTTGGLEVEVADGKLKIVKEGAIKKFVRKVHSATFSGATAVANQQVVHYITERCVFVLTPQGIELVEIAPGVDLQKDVLDQMEFTPLIRKPLRLMDAAIFQEKPMGLMGRNFGLNLSQRIFHCKASNQVYIDLKNVRVYDEKTVREIDDAIRQAAKEAGGKMDAIVTYDGFDVAPHLIDRVAASARGLERDVYTSVRRYSSRCFARNKLTSSLRPADGKVAEPMSVAEAYRVARMRGLAVSWRSFEDLFVQYAEGSDRITPATLQKIVNVAAHN